MATIVLTESAKHLARRLINEMPEYGEPSRLIVAVVWSNGVRDNRRGPGGEVVWETTEAPGWKSVIAPWVETPEIPMAQHTVEMDGLTVFVDPRAKSAVGTLIVDAAEGALSVVHQSP